MMCCARWLLAGALLAPGVTVFAAEPAAQAAEDGGDTAAEPTSARTPAASEAAPDEAIARLDRNGNGALDPEEFRNGMMQRFGTLDADSNGTLEAAEIPPDTRIAGLADARGNVSLEQFQQAIPGIFANLDTDGDGALSSDEIRAARKGRAK